MNSENKLALSIQNNFLQFYKKKIIQHEWYALGFLIFGILLALSGVFISIFIYDIKITKLEEFRNKIEIKKLDDKKIESEIQKIETELGGSDYEFYEISNLSKLNNLIQERKEELYRYGRSEILNELMTESAFKEKLFYPEGKVKIESLMVKKNMRKLPQI
ncbi:MAG TPA: hypothetical protein PKL30_26400 [Leptospiraceae bacterium]|nr:hypothetical protein [Leptospiraceae bacterium]